MMDIILNKKEFDYLITKKFLNSDLLNLLNQAKSLPNGLKMLSISEEDADKIRNQCGEQLQLTGFDKDYKPTNEGQILESLIDKFYIDT